MTRTGGVLALAASLTLHSVAQSLNQFGPPHVDQMIVNATIGSSNVATVDDCASACLAVTGAQPCIAFSVDLSGSPGASIPCTLSTWSANYSVVSSPGNQYYFVLMARNDTRVVPAMQYALQTPTAGVTLSPDSLFGRIFALNRVYLSQYPVDDMLYWFRMRAGQANVPGTSFGWDDANFEGGYGLRGSIAGAFLMGAGGYVRWANDTALWDAMVAVVEGIAAVQQSDGFAMAFNHTNTHCRENPDYVSSWFTHGMLEAAEAGIGQALTILRGHFDWFNYAGDELAQYLPPGGGPHMAGLPWPGGVPVNPYVPPYCRRDLQTNQGMIHNTRLALSPVGTWGDVQLVQQLYEEEWWLKALAARDLEAVWMRHYYPHNYEITAWEAFADMAVITGDPKYLAAVDGAWEMLREHWMHVGGSVAINENQLYPPDSYFLEPPGPDWQHPTPTPTGELCGSSFWMKLNQRLLRLRPTQEVYAWEIERSILNVLLASISADGTGIRYFARLHQNKDTPSNVSTCCEGQGTREFGALPEYLYSTSTTAVHVHIYQSSSILTTNSQGEGLQVSVSTSFPYDVTLSVTVSGAGTTPASVATLLLRMPSWTTETVVPVTLGNGTVLSGITGTYLPVMMSSLPVSLSFSLPMALTTHLYNGSTTIGAGRRAAVQYGPVLLAAVGPFTTIGNSSCLVLPALDLSQPSSWLLPVPGEPLHYTVAGVQGVMYKPYFEVQDEIFTAYPIFGAY